MKSRRIKITGSIPDRIVGEEYVIQCDDDGVPLDFRLRRTQAENTFDFIRGDTKATKKTLAKTKVDQGD